MTSHKLILPNGFTFLEIMVAIALLSGLSVALTQVFFTTTRSSTKTEILKEVKQSGAFALQVMERMVRNARSITSACSASGTSGPSLSIVGSDEGVTTFACDFQAGVNRIASTSALGTAYLTSEQVTLGGSDCSTSSLLFECTTSAGGAPERVKVSYTLWQKSPAGSGFEKASQSFQSTVTLRN